MQARLGKADRYTTGNIMDMNKEKQENKKKTFFVAFLYVVFLNRCNCFMLGLHILKCTMSIVQTFRMCYVEGGCGSVDSVLDFESGASKFESHCSQHVNTSPQIAPVGIVHSTECM